MGVAKNIKGVNKMKRTVIHEGTNNHYTLDKIEINGQTITAPKPFKIDHAEHEALDIPEGEYEHKGVVEVVPYEKQIREVAD